MPLCFFFFFVNAIYIFIWFSFLFSANKSDWVLDKFDVTVPMSTYLVAYTINDFEFRESPADGDVVFRIWARRDAISQVNQYKHCVVYDAANNKTAENSNINLYRFFFSEYF